MKRFWALGTAGVLLGGGLLHQVTPATDKESSREGGVESWVSEVRAQADSVQCRFTDPAHRRVELKRRTREIDARTQRARLISGDFLASAAHLQELLSCDDAQLSETPEWNSLTHIRSVLLDQVARHLRGYHALLRRAQEQDEADQALRAVEALRELLREHEGPLSSKLDGLERYYGKMRETHALK